MKDQVQIFLSSRAKYRVKVFAGLIAFVLLISLAVMFK